MTVSNREEMLARLDQIAGEHAERLNGTLPPTMVLSGYMVARVVDALRKVEGTNDGK